MKTLKLLKLPSGTTGFYNEQNQYVPTASCMGRRDVLPDDRQTPCKLRMEKLRWVDGDYDQWGAYWGYDGRNSVFCAFGDVGEISARVFVRAISRKEAKALVRATLPNVTFFR